MKMQKTFLIAMLFIVMMPIVYAPTSAGDLTWAYSSFHIYQSDSLTIGNGTLVCFLQMTDTDDEVIACVGSNITDSTDYCMEYNISIESGVDFEVKWKYNTAEDNGNGYWNIVGVMGTGNIFGTGASVNDCAFYDYGSDDKYPFTTCDSYIHSTQTDTIQFRANGIQGNEEIKILSNSADLNEGIRVCVTSGTGTTNDVSNYLYTLENKGGITERSNNISFSAEIIPLLEDCGNMYSDFNMTKNLNSSATCFNIKNNDITLDCKNYNINYSNSATGYAINITNVNNTIIKNCNIYQENSSISNSHGIYFNNADNGLIENNNIETYNSFGILLSSSANNNTFLNNNISSIGNEIQDNTGISFINYLIYDNEYGRIAWTGNNLTFDGIINLENNLYIDSNILAINTSAFTGNINTSASLILSAEIIGFTEIRRLDYFTKDRDEIVNYGTDCLNATCFITDVESNGYMNVTFNATYLSSFTLYMLDVFPPSINLISPDNNTINNTFPMNITFFVSDDSPNITCILTNNTYIFDDGIFSTGINYLTLQIGNLSEISQNFPNLNLSCYDNTEQNNSATMMLNYTIDKVLPLIIILSPEIDATFNTAFTSSIQVHTTCFDDNIYRLNVTISNSSETIFSEEDMTPIANILEINSTLDISELGVGIYEKSDYCADSHTAKAIPNYNTIKIAGSGIRWITPSGNEFELKCSYSEGILDYGFYKSADDDRYVFYYNINDVEDGSTFDIECELENRKFPVAYLSNSEYPAHFIMENNWMDFVLEDDDEAEYEVSLNENDNYVITISTTKTNLTFSSVGELNTVEVLSTITITYAPPRQDEYVLGTCPVDTLPRAMLFMFFILLAFLIMGIGYGLRNGLIGTIGSIFLIGTGVYLWFCLAFASLIMMGLGTIMASMFVFKGIRAFR